jgi:hypothetical protein
MASPVFDLRIVAPPTRPAEVAPPAQHQKPAESGLELVSNLTPAPAVAAPEPAPPVVPTHFTWGFAGAPVLVEMSLAAVEQIELELWRATRSAEPSGVHLGGILLGSFDAAEALVRVEDIASISCAPEEFHTYLALALHELARGKNPLAPVGFYRSSSLLALDRSDLSLADTYFSKPGDVFLIIRPSERGPAAAGFFFWEGGKIHSEFSFLEFPFHPEILSQKAVEIAHREALLRVQPELGMVKEATADVDVVQPAARMAEAGAAPMPLPEAPSPQPMWEPDLPTIPDPAPEPAQVNREPWFPAAPAPAETPAAAPSNSPIFTRWEPQAPPAHGRRRLWLGAALIAASLAAVGFGLDLPGRFQILRSAPAVDTAALSLRVERVSGDLRVSWDRRSPVILNARRGVLTIKDGPDMQKLELDPNSLRSESVIYSPGSESVQFRLDVYAQDDKNYGESVLVVSPTRRPAAKETDPIAPSSKGMPAAAQKPALITGASRRPIFRIEPAVPANLKRMLSSGTQVDVRVRIDPSGKVVEATNVAQKGQFGIYVADMAVEAARQWKFEPVQMAGQAAQSEAILEFRFGPEQR